MDEIGLAIFLAAMFEHWRQWVGFRDREATRLVFISRMHLERKTKLNR